MSSMSRIWVCWEFWMPAAMHRSLAPIGRAVTLSVLLSGACSVAALAQSPNQGGTVMTDPAQAGGQFAAKPGHASAGGNASGADAAAHPAAQPAPGPAPTAGPPANPPAPKAAGKDDAHAATDAPAPVAAAAPASAVDPDQAALIKKGEYIAIASDCAPCHMAVGGTKYAGGLILNTPFGQMATPNITPDRETGIGSWTADQFYGVIHNGIGPGHKYIYPTMTFPSYTQMPRS